MSSGQRKEVRSSVRPPARPLCTCCYSFLTTRKHENNTSQHTYTLTHQITCHSLVTNTHSLTHLTAHHHLTHSLITKTHNTSQHNTAHIHILSQHTQTHAQADGERGVVNEQWPKEGSEVQRPPARPSAVHLLLLIPHLLHENTKTTHHSTHTHISTHRRTHRRTERGAW